MKRAIASVDVDDDEEDGDEDDIFLGARATFLLLSRPYFPLPFQTKILSLRGTLCAKSTL